ncbi:MAG: zinc-ribbon domain-containing protein [Deltaproteobacteria bacterium]|nr:zinc-ribbon domain-containing protein [Deltaproteobacteria bacterium]
MIIQCDKCATRFRLDDSRITPSGVKVRCTKCDNVFIVTPPPPPEEVQVEELFGVAPGMDEKSQTTGEKNLQSKAMPPKRKEDDRHLAFDFDSEVTREDIFKPTAGSGTDEAPGFDMGLAPEEEKPGQNKKLTLDGLDFSFSEDRSGEEKEDSSWLSSSAKDSVEDPDEDPFAGAFDEPVASKEPTEEKVGFGVGLSAGAPGAPGATSATSAIDDDKTDFDFGFDAPPGEDEKDDEPSAPKPAEEKEAAEPEEEKPAKAENVIPFSAAAAYTREAEATAPSELDEDDTEQKGEAFKTVLSKTIENDSPLSFGASEEDEEGEQEIEEEDEPKERKLGQPRMGAIIAALIIVLGGGIIYFTGVIDKLTQILMPPSAAKVVEIESIKGFYEENKNFGKLFVIDARVKNITDEPQAVKAATGVVYDDSGDKIAEKSVSPGRIVSIDDIRNLQKEELERAFRDPSGGIIPPKGSVPVMVLFIEVPEGLSEFGVDIVR